MVTTLKINFFLLKHFSEWIICNQRILKWVHSKYYHFKFIAKKPTFAFLDTSRPNVIYCLNYSIDFDIFWRTHISSKVHLDYAKTFAKHFIEVVLVLHFWSILSKIINFFTILINYAESLQYFSNCSSFLHNK